MYCPCSENKGADQLRGYREADLRLCFRICRLLVFPWGGSLIAVIHNDIELHHGKTCFLHNCAKTKTQISCAVTAHLIRPLFFATWIVQSHFLLNPKPSSQSVTSKTCGKPKGQFSCAWG